MVAGAELFTGNNLIVMAWADRRISLARLLRNWGIVYAGNLVGALATAVLVFAARQYEFGDGAVGLNALAIANTKASLGWGQAVALGILCNALVCLAVWLSYGARSLTDKFFAILLPISAFVAAGFEHSVANMYFLPVGLFVKSGAADSFWHTTGASAGDYGDLTWGHAAFDNLLPVTLGNVFGGAVMVGLVYWLVYRRPRQGSSVPELSGRQLLHEVVEREERLRKELAGASPPPSTRSSTCSRRAAPRCTARPRHWRPPAARSRKRRGS